MGPIDARRLMQAGEWETLQQAGSWRQRRAEKKAAKQTKKEARKAERQTSKEALRRKTVRYDPRTYGSYGTAGSMSGFRANQLSTEIARGAELGLDPMATRGQDFPEPDLPIDDEIPLKTLIVPPAEEPAKTWMQKNWPYVAGGAAVLIIGGIVISKKK